MCDSVRERCYNDNYFILNDFETYICLLDGVLCVYDTDTKEIKEIECDDEFFMKNYSNLLYTKLNDYDHIFDEMRVKYARIYK